MSLSISKVLTQSFGSFAQQMALPHFLGVATTVHESPQRVG
jgi:hypothetical protein